MSRGWRTMLDPIALAVAVPLFFTPPPVVAQCEQAKLTAGDAFDGQRFGAAVDIDGDLAVVGAIGPPPPPNRASPGAGDQIGAAYVFRREGGAWIEEARLQGSDQDGDDVFAASVSISGDRIVVAAPDHTHPGIISGVVYVFRREGTTWVEEAELVPIDVGGRFGSSVSLEGDHVVVGATSAANAEGTLSGAAYVFRREGTSWIQEAKLTPSDGDNWDYFGNSVSISGDLVVVGAERSDDAGTFSGSAYVFRWDGTTWVEEAKLTAPDAAEYDSFGGSVAIHGQVAIIGAGSHAHSGTRNGAAYVFRGNGGVWLREAELAATDGAEFDRFARSVAIRGDLVVVGAPGDDDACPTEIECDSGSAYMFRRSAGIWIQDVKLTASDAARGDDFGTVAIDGNQVLVGAWLADGPAQNSGATYVFAVSECVTRIPVVSRWGLVVMVALILTAGTIIAVRRAPVARGVNGKTRH